MFKSSKHTNFSTILNICFYSWFGWSKPYTPSNLINFNIIRIKWHNLDMTYEIPDLIAKFIKYAPNRKDIESIYKPKKDIVSKYPNNSPQEIIDTLLKEFFLKNDVDFNGVITLLRDFDIASYQVPKNESYKGLIEFINLIIL
jgi:hypothetical protein